LLSAIDVPRVRREAVGIHISRLPTQPIKPKRRQGVGQCSEKDRGTAS
jgi:hypothetical protein